LAVFRIDHLRRSPIAAHAVRDRIASLFKATRGARTPVNPAIIRLAEGVLFAAIFIVLAPAMWALFGPVVKPSAAVRQNAAPVEQAASGPIDPFRITSAAAPAAADDFANGPDLAETSLNLALHGTWIDAQGGAAIIKTPDDKQGRFSVGDTITSGVTLERVYRDQVVINRGGVRESLRLVNRELIASQRPAEAVTTGSNADDASGGIASIGRIVIATPELDPVGNMRLTLRPAGDPEAFEALGLETGDILIAVDNSPIGADISKALETIASLQGKTTVTLSIERDGAVMPIKISLNDEAPAQND
jgi:type II secretion system protein C